jgi:hypothetical protein
MAEHSFMATLRLGAFASELSGKSGNTVFVRTPNGVVVRDRIIPSDPNTPKQQARRAGMAQAMRAWQDLDPALAAQWRQYAESLARRDPASGAIRAPRAINVYTQLYLKLLQIDPQAPPPSTPPAQPFGGDSAVISVSGGPHLRFESDRANGPGVVTELLAQALSGRNCRAYDSHYRSQGFVAFDGSPFEVELPRGWYATACRFVNAETGQSGPLLPRGVVGIGVYGE